mmetsp:Transcript_81272/g.226274  ORF Transcript_81272/g.226274 Transcript_81272/m.226274 type:complete len:221 (-) Transcript_81272:687-1349(-)
MAIQGDADRGEQLWVLLRHPLGHHRRAAPRAAQFEAFAGRRRARAVRPRAEGFAVLLHRLLRALPRRACEHDAAAVNGRVSVDPQVHRCPICHAIRRERLRIGSHWRRAKVEPLPRRVDAQRLLDLGLQRCRLALIAFRDLDDAASGTMHIWTDPHVGADAHRELVSRVHVLHVNSDGALATDRRRAARSRGGAGAAKRRASCGRRRSRRRRQGASGAAG